MGEGVGNDDASRLLLQTVIADRACRVHCGLDIALFNDVLGAIGVMGPDPGQAVGLQFDLDRNCVGAAPVASRLLTVGGLQNAERILHVVADFMRDDISLGELARRMEAGLHLLEKREIEVHLLVIRTIEWTGGRAGEPAGRGDPAGVEHEFRFDIGLTATAEYLLPDVLGVGDDDGNKMPRRIGRDGFRRPRCAVTATRGVAAARTRPAGVAGPRVGLLLGQLIAIEQSHQCARIDPEKKPHNDDDNRADTPDAADRHRHAAATPILDVLAFAIADPPHYPSSAGRFSRAPSPASKNHACSLPVPDHEAGGVQRWGTGEPFEPVVQPWGGDPSSRRRRVFVMIGRSRLRPGLQLFGRCLMKTKVIAAAAVLGITALASWSPPANAAGCLKGALIGGLAGHFAGHGILGAGAGCLVGRHYANRAPRTQMTQSQTRTVTRYYDTTLNRTGTRDGPTVPVMRRQQSEESGYGSSNPEPMRYNRLR